MFTSITVFDVLGGIEQIWALKQYYAEQQPPWLLVGVIGPR